MMMMMMMEQKFLLECLLPLVLSVVSHSNAVHPQGRQEVVSLSLDHSGVGTDNPYHANILWMMHNGHTVLVFSSVPQWQLMKLRLALLL